MAQDFAQRFYLSKAWKRCRKAYIHSVHYECERCNDGTLGYIVHHKVHLTPDNIHDPSVSLSHDNLEYLCKTCHNLEHNSGKPDMAEGLAFNANGDLIRVST